MYICRMEELKYKRDRVLYKTTCDFCGIEYNKPLSEAIRNKRLNRRSFCSRACSVRYGNKMSPKGGIANFKGKIGNRSDEFTPFRYYYKHAKKRYKEFSLNIQDLKEQWELQESTCPYSGIILELRTHSKKVQGLNQASLDRIDSSKGYVKGNIQWVSTNINYMKGQLSHEETLELCRMIAENYTKNNVIL